MKYKVNRVVITLESEQEIESFYNIIKLAISGNGKGDELTNEEFLMARQLAALTKQ